MILTLTPNPSLDLLFELDRLVWDDANRLAAPRRRPGGQGVNVARAAAALGAEVLAVAPLGGPFGAELRRMLEAESLPLRTVPIAGETRVFVGIRERSEGRNLLLNPSGPELAAGELAALERAVVDALEDLELAGRAPGWLACCGSVPPGADPGIYARLGVAARARGVRVVPDCDGEALRLAAESGCDLLVPNRHEAGRLLGSRIATIEDAAGAAAALLGLGPSMAIVTLGAAGAVAATRQGVWYAAAPKPPGAASAVGAGDAFLAGLMLGLDGGAEPPEALRRGVAAGTAVLSGTGAELISAATVAALLADVPVRSVR